MQRGLKHCKRGAAWRAPWRVASQVERLIALAMTPYDLRHAAVSTWLDGGDALIRQRVQAALGYDDTATDVPLSHVRP